MAVSIIKSALGVFKAGQHEQHGQLPKTLS